MSHEKIMAPGAGENEMPGYGWYVMLNNKF